MIFFSQFITIHQNSTLFFGFVRPPWTSTPPWAHRASRYGAVEPTAVRIPIEALEDPPSFEVATVELFGPFQAWALELWLLGTKKIPNKMVAVLCRFEIDGFGSFLDMFGDFWLVLEDLWSCFFPRVDPRVVFFEQVLVDYKDGQQGKVIEAINRMPNHLTAGIVSNNPIFINEARMMFFCLVWFVCYVSVICCAFGIRDHSKLVAGIIVPILHHPNLRIFSNKIRSVTIELEQKTSWDPLQLTRNLAGQVLGNSITGTTYAGVTGLNQPLVALLFLST